jgi:hypothetical protein
MTQAGTAEIGSLTSVMLNFTTTSSLPADASLLLTFPSWNPRAPAPQILPMISAANLACRWSSALNVWHSSYDFLR